MLLLIPIPSMLPTTLTSIAALIVQALNGRGIDGLAILGEAGLDPSRLQDSSARYPFSGMTVLWERAVEETGDECFGLQVSRLIHPTSLHALGFAWLASDTLADALARFERYCSVATTAMVASLELAEDHYALTARPSASNGPPAGADLLAATLVRLCRWSIGESFRPLKVRVPRERPGPDCLRELRSTLRAPIEFGAPYFAMSIDRGTAEQRLLTGNAELAHANEAVLVDYLAHLDRSAVAMRVKAELVNLLPAGPVAEPEMAGRLNLSMRSLQRRLREEQTSYRALVDETRQELARQYLGNSRLTINEIGYLLGFSDPSNFTRAFRRWEGRSPSRYREEQSAAA